MMSEEADRIELLLEVMKSENAAHGGDIENTATMQSRLNQQTVS